MNRYKTSIDDPNPKIPGISLLLTYRCTAECSHCFTSSSTSKDDPMKLSEVQEYLEEAKKVGAKWVWFFGGEPFFYFDLLTGSVEYAKQIGFSTNITSNAFWATSRESALKRLRLLKEKGLDLISFSADPFHWEYVPLEYIRNAAKAAKELGIRVEGIWNCYFTEKEGNEVFRLSQEISTRLSEHGVSVGKIMFQGTAAEVLAEYAPRQSWTMFNKCHEESSQLHSLGFVSIDPYGYVQPCSGISIGNARERKLSEIIKTYDPQAHPILKVLCEEGPVGLARMAMNYGFEPTEYADDCHLCYEARKVLLEHYPEYLAPTIWYKKAKTDSRKAHAISTLGKPYQHVDLKGKALDALLLSARDANEYIRRASIFALEDCISDETKDKIFSLFEDLLEDEAKAVKYGALEALTEVLPYNISDKAFDRILGFLQADEPWVRWRVALALNKAYSELNAEQKERATSVLTELIKDEDIFVKVRAYEAFLNIKDLEKRAFPEVDERLGKESDFVRQWALYNLDQR